MVISPVAAPLAGELAALVPVINISDATFELMRSFYPAFARIDNDVAAAAEEAERRCILGAVHNSFSSAWAARSAVSHYGAPEASVSVISWGCNIPDVPPQEMRSADPSRQVCRLLFLGADWVRKGGDVAAATAEILASRGFALQLDLVGSTALEGVPDAPWIQMHGFLSKADPEQKARLEMLVRNADFLFLPTRQDCTPMVFAEANAYGTPAITRDVGGVADVVRHGRNGFVLPDDASPADFADCIERTWGERAGYAKLRETARREYEERLNWWSWARAIAEIVHAERLAECPNSTQQL